MSITEDKTEKGPWWSALPPESRNITYDEVTETQKEMMYLAANLGTYGIDIRFDSDQIDHSALLYLRLITGFIRQIDNHSAFLRSSVILCP